MYILYKHILGKKLPGPYVSVQNQIKFVQYSSITVGDLNNVICTMIHIFFPHCRACCSLTSANSESFAVL